jgi:phosphatidylserine/phosphatidylglycerophosphate/cardiolipin synthase-like enzyme
MAKFLKGFDVNTEVENIFRQANSFLWIISPYIKLHHRYKDVLKNHICNDKLQITLVFGKNDRDMQKSLSKEEVDFFLKFPNIEIRYEKRLHAKFYANDYSSIITSMNLYDFSQDNNIEAGVLLDTPLLNRLTRTYTVDQQAMDYFSDVIDNSELLFRKEPQYTSGTFGIGKKFDKSIVIENKIEDLIKLKKETRQNPSHTSGFCIKCHTEIPLKPTVPYCKNCYSDWKKINDKTHQEVFCHICGEKNKSSLAFPACRNCYRKEKQNLEFPLNR